MFGTSAIFGSCTWSGFGFQFVLSKFGGAVILGEVRVIVLSLLNPGIGIDVCELSISRVASTLAIAVLRSARWRGFGDHSVSLSRGHRRSLSPVVLLVGGSREENNTAVEERESDLSGRWFSDESGRLLPGGTGTAAGGRKLVWCGDRRSLGTAVWKRTGEFRG